MPLHLHALESSLKNKRLERAVEYVGDYWFPVSPAILEKIQLGVDCGAYDGAIDLLIEEIKGDFSLFTYTIGKLVRMLKEEGVPLQAPLNPIDLFYTSGLDRLKSVFEIKEREISFHTLETANEFQVARHKESMLSASTAEVLAESYEIDSDTAYSAALLRQLGYTLISWNYPGLYVDAMAAVRAGQNLDLVLTKQLGFSPQMLAMRLLQGWGLTPDLCQSVAVLDEEDVEERQILDSIGGVLAKICRVGETLARANNPAHYPTARDDWEIAKKEVESRLGTQGLKLIEQRYLEHCESYLTYVPEIFRAGMVLNQLEQEAPAPEEYENPYLRVCEPDFKRELLKFYRRISAERMSKENVRMLLKETLPALGFSSGCVYTIEPGLMMLVPQTHFGEVSLRALDPVDYSISRSNADMVGVAFHSGEPSIAFNSLPSGEVVLSLANIFGGSQRIGVLYLELTAGKVDLNEQTLAAHLRAVCCALNHCLGLD